MGNVVCHSNATHATGNATHSTSNATHAMERPELEDPEFEVEALPRGAEMAAGPRPHGSLKEQRAANSEQMEKTGVQDRVQALRVRQTLELLDEMHEEKDASMQKTREELSACRQRMSLLSKQQKSLAAQTALEQDANNMAAAGRLEAASRRLHAELENEEALRARITATLREDENAMWHIELEKGQFEEARKHLQEEAGARERRLQAHAARQLHQEEEAWGKAQRNRLLRTRKSMHLQRELGLRHQKLLEDAQKNHRVAVKFLKASLGRVREREQKEETKSQKHMKRRMDAVLALKNNITANRETLRKFQAWGQARAELAEQKARAGKELTLARGGDACRHLIHQHRHQELEAERRAFEEEQKLRRQEIVSKILKEEAEEQRKRQRHRPARAAPRRTLRDKTWTYISDFCEGKAEPVTSGYLEEEEEHEHCKNLWLTKGLSTESVQVDLSALHTPEDILAEPEIPGLWSEDHKLHQVPKEEVDQKPVGGTKMERDILARTVEQLRGGIVHKQVVSGREFKGRPFNSKPEVIHFKDFDVGKVYKKKVTLINATYTINYCKLVGVEESLRDFIHVDFDPPGPMSAGMSCEVLVTFKPMINKDLEGNVSFLAQTGGFSVPLKCSTKKCSLSLDTDLIHFGSYTVGETTTQAVTLTNVGGLGTRFRFLVASGSSDALEDFQPELKMSSLFTFEDKSVYEKILTSSSEPHFEAFESLVDLPNRRESEKQDEADVATMVNGGIPSEELTEITLGKITQGEIGPFSSIKVPIIFAPAIPGEVEVRFKVIFKDPQSPPLHFRALGLAVDVPVWLPRPTVDLKICMYDRLYQDSILVHTRSKAALRLKFEVCKELRGHMELLPETGYIQAMSTYSVQLKFFPRHSLPEDAGKYFDKETRVLEAPMIIRVADQIKPVEFTVQAIVTTSDLELSPSEVDFGHCTVYEALRTEISLSNHSLLPQMFGFVGLPKFVDIQPNDGFGTIMPLETLQLDVIFQPAKAKEYSFELVCKSEINRCFRLSCRAVGVLPPLELSHYQIKFAATALYDTSVATLYVINSHLSMNKLTHSLPRIGSEEASPVGPTSFEFLPPPDLPITISPSVGTVLPGKRCLVQVAFRPVLSHEVIMKEAMQITAKELETKAFRKDTFLQKKELWKQSLNAIRTHSRDRPFRVSIPQAPVTTKQEINSSSPQYEIAKANLTRTFQGKFDKFVVPCVVASGDLKDRKALEPMNFSPHNTLYLELWCPTVAPPIVVTSGKGQTVFDFGDIAVGHRGIMKVSLQNITSEDLSMEFSVLNPNGPFVLLNPSSKLRSGNTHVLALSFSPHESIMAQETLNIITKRGTLTLTFLGTGVASMITCSIEGDVLNMGYVMARESVSSSFKLQNDSSLPIKFWVQLESLSSTRAEARQQLPKFLSPAAHRTEVVGTQNHNGQSVFSVSPVEGLLLPGKAQDFTVTFSPDHESLYYSDRLQVVLFEKKVSHRILLKGAAREHMMFVEGGDALDVPVESLTVMTAWDPEHREEAEDLKPILVTLDYVQLDIDAPAPPATRELHVGCIRTTQPAAKKTGEFTLDSLTWLQHKGFSIEPSRGSVERGQTKTISISWVPPADFDPDHPLMAWALLQLRGDVKETYKIIFVANVVTGA
ncbi:cilia- and flagella-associated protein 74 [Perognathus longimembris pacificus]|uniref:cilia- and flagella-associated protein 74 n=1 Tax=Perognathus longimembris pacificus TaxID=214514 RepID=UPI002019FF07|nr:cilia- and flagella-associated protein 74 [Perognathus longimembris pacificus]